MNEFEVNAKQNHNTLSEAYDDIVLDLRPSTLEDVLDHNNGHRIIIISNDINWDERDIKWEAIQTMSDIW